MSAEGWQYPDLAMRIPSPPLIVGDGSTSSDLESARRAIDLGLASVTQTGRGTGPFAVELVTAVPLPSGWLRGGGATALRLALLHPLMCIAVVLVSVAAGMLQNSLLWWACVCLIIVGVSMIAHEAGHVVALRLVAGPEEPVLLRATPISARLIWRSTGTAADLIVIAAGPLSPLLLAIPFTPLLVAAPVAGIAVVVVAVSHLVTLFLRSGDGGELRTVVRALKGLRTSPDPAESTGT